MSRTKKAGLTLAVMLAAGAVPAFAHQTAYDGPVAVTVHVTPDDEPIAGRSSTVSITRITVRKGSFSFKTGRTRIRISDSNGHVVLNRRTGRKTRFTFPRPGAYKIVISGRAKRGGHYRAFSTPFAIRAS
jgi:hypothetical protein